MPEYHQVEATIPFDDPKDIDLDAYRSFLRHLCPDDPQLHRWSASLSIRGSDEDGVVYPTHPRPVVQLRDGGIVVRAEPYVHAMTPDVAESSDRRSAVVLALLL